MNKKKKNKNGKRTFVKKTTDSSQPGYRNNGVLQFSDQPTLLDIANQNGGAVGYDISINGFVSTQGNRTYAVISPGLQATTINLQPGLPIYMGTKANSEVEYPTLDSNNTPSATGQVSTTKMSFGRQDALATVNGTIKYAYQGLTPIFIQDDTITTAPVSRVIGLLPTSLVAMAEHNNKITTLMTRLQSTVAIEDLEFLQLTTDETDIKYVTPGATVDLKISYNDKLDFMVQSTLLHLYQRDVQAMASDYMKAAQLVAQINHLKHKMPSISKQLEINYDVLKKATNFTAFTRLFTTINEEYVDLPAWNIDIKPLSILSTSKWGVDGYIKEPAIDFMSHQLISNFQDPTKPDGNFKTQIDVNGSNELVYKYKSGDISFEYNTYNQQFTDLWAKMCALDLTKFTKYMADASQYIKDYLAKWKDMVRIIKVCLQTVTAAGICNWTRFVTLPQIKDGMIDNLTMFEDMIQMTAMTLPIEKMVVDGELQIRSPIFDDLSKPVPLLMMGQSYSRYWPVAKYSYNIVFNQNGSSTPIKDIKNIYLIFSDGTTMSGDLYVDYHTFPLFVIDSMGVDYLSEYMGGMNYATVKFNSGFVPEVDFKAFTVRKAQQLLRFLPAFTTMVDSTNKVYEFFVSPNIITDTIARAPDFERLTIDTLRANGIINTFGNAN